MKAFAIPYEQTPTHIIVMILTEDGDLLRALAQTDLMGIETRMRNYGEKIGMKIEFKKDWLQDEAVSTAILNYEEKTGLKLRPGRRSTSAQDVFDYKVSEPKRSIDRPKYSERISEQHKR